MFEFQRLSYYYTRLFFYSNNVAHYLANKLYINFKGLFQLFRCITKLLLYILQSTKQCCIFYPNLFFYVPKRLVHY